MREYANFFEWHDRGRAELRVVEELIETLARRGERQLHSPDLQRPDPPDCTCLNEEGELVAVEVTEIVCSEAARLNAQGHDVSRHWRPGELRDHVDELLATKDSKTYASGPFAEIIVCMFTDEPLLTIDRIAKEIDGAVFGPFKQVTGAYILVSYDPSTKSYPVQSVRIRNAD